MNSLCQIHSVSRKIAEDVGKELERSASCHQQEMRFYEKRAQGSRVVAVALERKPKELRQEQDRNRQMLAKVENPTSSLSQGALVLLLCHPEPTEAQSCQGSPRVMKPPRQEKDPILRAQKPGVTCRVDSGHSSQVWTPTTWTQHLYVLLSYSNLDIFLFTLATAIYPIA
ncbi:hypothetical protein MG293_000053 [Ovis ammon polii]|uniref:Uncharacterized protein n=1 Tax=Ovis ammon polii TaxID=230172 RepID=A0AAD4YH44_OVIAM|nr:hypothetical protein MG293_000053 [Ovis ammon polii]